MHSGCKATPDQFTQQPPRRWQPHNTLPDISQRHPCIPHPFPSGTLLCPLLATIAVRVVLQIRDTDLDTLEQLVACLTWGDIEAEDTRHLSEGNFVKVFRLAQLLLEYLLYVQENLKYTNGVLDQSRWVGAERRGT